MSSNRLDEFKRKISSYSGCFDEKKYDLNLYYQVINSKEFTVKEIKDILCWKLAGKRKYEQLPKSHRKLINRAIEKLMDINNFKNGRLSESDFDKVAKYISPTGHIIRLFLFHISKPKEYALFDQHTFRAFYYFETGKIHKGSITFAKVRKYYDRYSSFFRELCEEFKGKHKPKDIDNALMAYGKELKKNIKES